MFVGTDLCVCPVNIKCVCPDAITDERVCPDAITDERVCPDVTEGTHAGVPLCASNKIPISTVVQWFKTMTTNHYIRGVRQNGWQPFEGRLWQLNYWERIIRDENEHQHIADYIINNPIDWANDKLNNK